MTGRKVSLTKLSDSTLGVEGHRKPPPNTSDLQGLVGPIRTNDMSPCFQEYLQDSRLVTRRAFVASLIVPRLDGWLVD